MRTPDCDENAYGQKQHLSEEDTLNGKIAYHRATSLSKEASKRIKTDHEHFGNFRITMTASHSKRGRRQLVSSSIAGLSSAGQDIYAKDGKTEYGQSKIGLKLKPGEEAKEAN